MVRLTQCLLFAALATAGAAWIPIFRAGSTVLELANVGDLLLVACAPLFVLSRRRANAPAVLNLIALLLAVLGSALLLRGGNGLDPVVQATAALLAAYAVVNLKPLSARQLETPVALGLAGFLCLFVMSSLVAGVDLASAVWRYVLTLDRNTFVYQDLRPVWNAHVPGTEPEYVASVLNSVSASFSVFFLLSAALASRGSRLMLLCACFSLGCVVVLFSSSAVLTCLLGGLLIAARQMVVSGQQLRLSALWLPALVLISIPVLGYVTLFLEANLSSDVASRDARLAQYTAAIDLIDASPLLGAGYVTVGGQKIHNLLLFSWTSAGLPALLIVTAIYLCAIGVLLEGVAGAFHRNEFSAEYLVMSTLPLLFLVRTSVGGAGGLPAGAAMTALAIALLARRRLRRDGERFLFDRWRLRAARGPH